METSGLLFQLLELLVSWPVLIVVVIILFRKSIGDLVSGAKRIKFFDIEIERFGKSIDDFNKLQIIVSKSVLLQMRAIDAVLSSTSSSELLEEHKQKMKACANELEDHLKEIGD